MRIFTFKLETNVSIIILEIMIPSERGQFDQFVFLKIFDIILEPDF